ncbi:MAG: hypothetical protein LBN39_02475 [Planctomycetaceae bacterium]|nr:hypothetical protein [Planctomycetaceae bacterium]
MRHCNKASCLIVNAWLGHTEAKRLPKPIIGKQRKNILDGQRVLKLSKKCTGMRTGTRLQGVNCH